MQFLRNMSNVFGGSAARAESTSNGEEVAQLPEGALFIQRRESAKGARECLFPTALATVQRTEAPFHYQLVITRAYQEGEAELLDDIDDDDEESRIFALDQALQIHITESEDGPALAWRDLDEDGALYEFVYDRRRIDPVVFTGFVEACLRGVYEEKFDRSSMGVSAKELAEMFGVDVPRVKQPAVAIERVASTLPDVEDDEYLDKEPAVLALWNNERAGFMILPELEPDGEVEARLVQTAQFIFWLIVKRKGNMVIGHQLTSDMNWQGAPHICAVKWNGENNDAWCLKFHDQASFHRFHRAFSQCIYEVANAMDWSKLKDVDQEYVVSAFSEDVEMTDAEAEEEVADVLAEEDEESEEDGSDHQAPKWESKAKSKNSGLAVGHKGISVVLRGDQLGIFKETTDGSLELGGTVNQIKGPGRSGKAFAPNKIMLHDQDRTLVMMNPTNQHSLYQMDLETGKVVEEWKLNPDVGINAMTPLDKLAPLTAEQTLLGASHNALFQIDPRLSGNKMVQSNMKQYVTKNKFSSLATTEAGHIAVASEKGDVRLFDTLGKNAKTALPALGDPIKGIDVTKDGKWVIATCKTYLLLIDATIADGKYAGNSGFTRSFPADKKPKPIKLLLKPEHVSYMKGNINFSPARFNTGPNAKETAIITSCGEYVIGWDFEKVKKGKVDSYQIKKYSGNVVEDNFSFGNDKDIIVTLQDDVLMIPKKALKKPGRQSLGAPPEQSRSSIVNAPY